ncbi:MAG: hypothetical protein AAFQ47_11485 [Pseudomonadota bacterium]
MFAPLDIERMFAPDDPARFIFIKGYLYLMVQYRKADTIEGLRKFRAMVEKKLNAGHPFPEDQGDMPIMEQDVDAFLKSACLPSYSDRELDILHDRASRARDERRRHFKSVIAEQDRIDREADRAYFEAKRAKKRSVSSRSLDEALDALSADAA